MRGARVNALERHIFAPVPAWRVLVLVRGVLIVTALDTGRLAVNALASRRLEADLAVAHFELLDRLQPTPTTELRAGILFAVAALAALAAVWPARTVLVLVALLQTWSWSMTIHDNFQHHYFVSILLWCLVALPRIAVGAPGARWPRGDIVAPAYVFVAASVALTYLFTTLTKLDPAWVRGDVVAHLTRHLAPHWRPAWNAWVAGVTIGVELFVAVAYLAAPRVRWRTASVIAVSFHLSAEFVLRLSIGAFSVYMVGLAIVFLEPWGPFRTTKEPRAESVEQGHEEGSAAHAHAHTHG